MKTAKRIACGLLSAFLVLFSPVNAYVASASVSVAAGAYAIIAILAACGILANSETFQALIGSWTSEAEYLVRGASRQLGSYAQRVYDNARSGDIGVQETFVMLEGALISAVCCGWGDTVTGTRALADDLKAFLKDCIGLTNQGAYVQVPAVPMVETWGVTEWSKGEKYPLPSGYLTSPFFVSDSNYSFFLTVYAVSDYGSETMNVQNWYYANTLDIFGVYDVSKKKLDLYQRDAANSRYASYSAFTFSAYVNRDGTLKYSTDSMSYWKRDWVFCSPADAGDLPFPVFAGLEDAEYYVGTGEVRNAYVSGTVTASLDGYRSDVFDLAKGCVADVLKMPATADAGAEKLGVIADVYPAGTVEEIGEAVGAGGIAVDGITDVPVAGDATLADILRQVAALPSVLADSIARLFTVSADDLESGLSIPEAVSEKFPFCIPFDLAYLVEALAARREVPRFVIPIKFDYEFLHYEEEFVVDFAEWDGAVTVLRVMLDVLFCAGLIVGTRSLIRG